MLTFELFLSIWFQEIPVVNFILNHSFWPQVISTAFIIICISHSLESAIFFLPSVHSQRSKTSSTQRFFRTRPHALPHIYLSLPPIFFEEHPALYPISLLSIRWKNAFESVYPNPPSSHILRSTTRIPNLVAHPLSRPCGLSLDFFSLPLKKRRKIRKSGTKPTIFLLLIFFLHSSSSSFFCILFVFFFQTFPFAYLLIFCWQANQLCFTPDSF